MKTFFALSFCLLSLIALALFSCEGAKESPVRERRLRVVTTLFPLYDFARAVGGQKAEVELLLPPGVEPHGFEPRPKDILRINEAAIFVYTGNFMEPWAETIIKGIDTQKVLVVDASRGVTTTPVPKPDEHRHGDREERIDPHIWLDLGNAQKMVDNILQGFVEKDPHNREFYQTNAGAYSTRLRELDEKFRKGLAQCKTRLFVHGGHYAFHYLARRYDLTYVSVYGFSPNAEPSPRHLAGIVRTLRQHKIKHIFYEELLQPRVAETVARETGAKLLPLNGGHNVSREEMERGVTFISVLDQDLKNLREGLECR